MSGARLRSLLQPRIVWSVAAMLLVLAVYGFATSLAFESITQSHNGDRLVNALKLICAVAVSIAAAGTIALILLCTYCIKSFED